MSNPNNIDQWLKRLQLSIYEVSRLYDPKRAPNLELRIRNAYKDLSALEDRLNDDIARINHKCAEPWTIHDAVPECSECKNYTMALDGLPMCALTRRALM